MTEKLRRNASWLIWLWFILLAILFTRPLISRMSSEVAGEVGDNIYFIWMIGWVKKALFKLGVDPMNPSGARATDPGFDQDTLEERVEGPLYLLRNYEQTLTNWFLLFGYDVDYNLWGL